MRIAAVILAAGESSRLGQPKQLVRLDGETLLDRAIKTARAANCAPIVVVVGAERISRDGVVVVPNEQWRRGLGTSIRSGILNAPECDAVILMTCDQPLVTAANLRALIDARTEIAAAEYSGTLGIPAFFANSQFANLLALADDEGAKGIILAHESLVAKIPMPEAAIDIDTPEQLAKFRSEWTTSDSATQA